ncbi:MAG: protein kinase [Myxococcaceae bacterium]|nr:protein kinase [Myxococcaceae bacterium]
MLGRYELLFMLGQGGMGEVHLARLSGAGGFEKLCIVKTILPQMKAETQFVERFHHEARVLTHLTHANIAQVYDMGEADGTLFMAIEYVPGVDLARVETRAATTGTFLPLPISLHVGRLMAEALGYAHRKTSPEGTPLGIVHRDVSPQNVMVSYEGEVKVIDFGLAKSSARSKHTLPATVMGKLGYMSPEQALAQPVDARSDIFSAGIVLWEMIAGRPLYDGGTMAEMVMKMANPTVPSLREIRGAEVSEALDQVVLRALAKDPAARYGRADEFARALNEVAVREGHAISAEEAGNFVRAMCPEEFAAERNLQSQLSLMRKGGRPASSPGYHLKPKSGTVSAAEESFDGTFVRDSASSAPTAPELTPAQRALSVARAPSNIQVAADAAAPQAPPKRRTLPGSAQTAPARAQPPPADDDVPLEAPKKSMAPLIGVGVLVVLALGGGAAFFLGGASDAKKVDPPVAVVEPPVKKPLEPVQPLEPVAEAPVDAGAPPAEAVAVAPPRERVTPKGAVFKVIRRSDGAFIDLEKGQKLREGDRLRLVGAPVDGKAREVFGQARVLELKARGTVAELLMEEDDAHPDELFAFVDETVVDRPKVVGRKPEGTVVATARPEDPRPVEPRPVETKPAEVKPVDAQPVETKPVEAKPVETKPAETKPAELPKLKGQVVMVTTQSLLAGTDATVRLMIGFDSPAGTSCDVHLPNGLHKLFFGLRPGENNLTNLKQWAKDPNPDPSKDPRAKNYALIECRDAAAYLPFSVTKR